MEDYDYDDYDELEEVEDGSDDDTCIFPNQRELEMSQVWVQLTDAIGILERMDDEQLVVLAGQIEENLDAYGHTNPLLDGALELIQECLVK